MSEADFELIKELISAIDENKLSGMRILAFTDKFVVNTRQKRHYAQRAGGDKRIVALYDELWRLIPIYFD